MCYIHSGLWCWDPTPQAASDDGPSQRRGRWGVLSFSFEVRVRQGRVTLPCKSLQGVRAPNRPFGVPTPNTPPPETLPPAPSLFHPSRYGPGSHTPLPRISFNHNILHPGTPQTRPPASFPSLIPSLLISVTSVSLNSFLIPDLFNLISVSLSLPDSVCLLIYPANVVQFSFLRSISSQRPQPLLLQPLIPPCIRLYPADIPHPLGLSLGSFLSSPHPLLVPLFCRHPSSEACCPLTCLQPHLRFLTVPHTHFRASSPTTAN